MSAPIEPTLVEVFGAGTTQDATTITIPKANLPLLTALSSNFAEQLVGGLFLKWANYFKTEGYSANPDQSILVNTPSYGFDTLVDDAGTNIYFQTHTFSVTFRVEVEQPVLDPDYLA